MPAQRRSAALIVMSALSAACAVESPQDRISDELKLLKDPTILKSRVWVDYEWNAFERGAGDGEISLAGMWAWAVSSNQDWAVRVELPLDWHDAGEDVGDTSGAGFGDLELAAGTAFRMSKYWRTGGGVELHADSATNDAVGDGDWRLKPFWTVAWDTRQ